MNDSRFSRTREKIRLESPPVDLISNGPPGTPRATSTSMTYCVIKLFITKTWRNFVYGHPSVYSCGRYCQTKGFPTLSSPYRSSPGFGEKPQFLFQGLFSFRLLVTTSGDPHSTPLPRPLREVGSRLGLPLLSDSNSDSNFLYVLQPKVPRAYPSPSTHLGLAPPVTEDIYGPEKYHPLWYVPK